MIPPDHHGRPHLAFANEVVDRETGAGAVAVAEPADPGGQALEGDALGRQGQPSLEGTVLWEEIQKPAIDGGDVARVARQGGPPKRPDAAAEQRPDIGRDEARVCECFLYPGL